MFPTVFTPVISSPEIEIIVRFCENRLIIPLYKYLTRVRKRGKYTLNSSEEFSATATVPLRVLIATSYYEPAHLGGGPIQTLKALIQAAPERFEIQVICLNRDFGETRPLVDQPNSWISRGKIKVQYVDLGFRNLFLAFKSARDVDILYLNSLFSSRFSIFPMLLWRLGFRTSATVLVAPRGELDPGALALKTGKKRIFLRLFKFLRFPQNFIWHASSQIEANNIRASLGQNVKVVIRENETSLPSQAASRTSRDPGPLRLIFASRLHEKKGLHILLNALQRINETIELTVVGAFEDTSYERKCYQLVKQLPDHVRVTFRGPLPRESVLKEFKKADLFAFPTAAENFGHVIAEALSQSCPVMCSPTTPWSKILKDGGGIVVNNTKSEDWKNALEIFLEGGEENWEDSALRAERSFNSWQKEVKGDHVFDLVRKVVQI